MTPGANNGRDRTVFIAGATGRLGRLLATHFLSRGWRIRAVVRSRQKAGDLLPQEPRIEFVEGDLTDLSSFADGCRGCSLAIFAAGARRPAFATDAQSIADFQKVNVVALRNLGVAVLRAGNKPLIHLGSLFALGIQHSGAVNEDTVARPHSPFERSEHAGEQQLLDLHQTQGLDCRIMRLAPVTGATPRGGLLDSLRVASCDAEWTDYFVQNAHTRKPLLSASDFLTAIEQIIALGRSGRRYHFASGDFQLDAMVSAFRSADIVLPTLTDFMRAQPKRLRDLSEFLRSYLGWDIRVAVSRAADELRWNPQASVIADLWNLPPSASEAALLASPSTDEGT